MSAAATKESPMTEIEQLQERIGWLTTALELAKLDLALAQDHQVNIPPNHWPATGHEYIAVLPLVSATPVAVATALMVSVPAP